jgi:hypothetical protein
MMGFICNCWTPCPAVGYKDVSIFEYLQGLSSCL